MNVSQEGPPSWGPVVFSEDRPHDVLVDVYAEGRVDDQGDPGAAESGITLLELDDRPDDF